MTVTDGRVRYATAPPRRPHPPHPLPPRRPRPLRRKEVRRLLLDEKLINSIYVAASLVTERSNEF